VHFLIEKKLITKKSGLFLWKLYFSYKRRIFWEWQRCRRCLRTFFKYFKNFTECRTARCKWEIYNLFNENWSY
jgi:hypothetical protein